MQKPGGIFINNQNNKINTFRFTHFTIDDGLTQAKICCFLLSIVQSYLILRTPALRNLGITKWIFRSNSFNKEPTNFVIYQTTEVLY